MEEKKSSTLPMIFGIVSIVLSCTFGIGLIFAIISLILSKKAEPDGKRKAGIITSIIGMVLSVIALIVIIIMASITAAGVSATKGIYDDLSQNTTSYDWNISTEDDWNYDDLTDYDFDFTATTEAEVSVSDTTEVEISIPDPALDTQDTSQSDQAFGWKRIGGAVGGYIDVPDTYYTFYETGGYSDVLLYSEQYAYGMADIVTHFTYPSEYDAKMTAQNIYEANKSDSQVTSANIELYDTGSYQGYLVDSVYTDGIECRVFIFYDEDQNMQYISVEGLTTDEYSGIWKDVYDSYKLVQ